MSEALLGQLRPLVEAIARVDAEIAERAPQLADYDLFASLPGAGSALAPRLLVAFGERRERFPDAAAMQKYAGVAPVTERSGKQSWVHWRYAFPTFLPQTFVEWAGQTITTSFWARAFYDAHRAKGASYNATIRALAFKVDPRLVALLGRPRAVRRGTVSGDAPEAWLAAAQVRRREPSLGVAVPLGA
jgi:hypothetical protein